MIVRLMMMLSGTVGSMVPPLSVVVMVVVVLIVLDVLMLLLRASTAVLTVGWVMMVLLAIHDARAGIYILLLALVKRSPLPRQWCPTSITILFQVQVMFLTMVRAETRQISLHLAKVQKAVRASPVIDETGNGVKPSRMPTTMSRPETATDEHVTMNKLMQESRDEKPAAVLPILQYRGGQDNQRLEPPLAGTT